MQPINQLLADPSIRDIPSFPTGGTKLPTRDEANGLFKYYVDNVHSFYPVIQFRLVQNMVDAVYLSPAVPADAAHVALLLGVFASASHFWVPQDNQALIFASAEEATLMSSVWSSSALDILEYSRRTTSVSIEDIQASIIIAHLVYNTHGFSTMFRSLHSMTIMMARDLFLHKIDVPKASQEIPSRKVVKDETKRTIWWQIASTDW